MFLKRGEAFDQDHFPFFHSTYVAKRNKYSMVPQEKYQGDRKRKAIEQDDLAVRDQFLNQDLDCLADPSHLCLIVGTALLETIRRDTGVLSQIRRSYVRPGTDEDGHPIIAVKGSYKED